MTLPVPNLDDRTFEQLVAEARALIPRNFPTWTDHNLSDPGITLLELFAFAIEAAIYQTKRVPEKSLEHFAGLIGETRQTVDGQPDPIEQVLRRALEALRRQHRAITTTDFEFLITEAVAFFSNQPPLLYEHRADVSAVMVEISRTITALDRAAVAGDMELTLVSSANLEAGNTIVIDDEVKTEFVQLTSIDGVTVTTNSPFRFDHERGVKLKRVLAPIPETETVLAVPAKSGDSIVILEPVVQLRKVGVLRIDTEFLTEYMLVRGIRGIARAKAVVEDVDMPNVFPAEQFVKVVIVPEEPRNTPGLPTDELRQKVFEFLYPRRPLATRLQVVPPLYTPISITVTVVWDFNSLLNRSTVRQRVEQAVQNFLSPLTGGEDGKGWEFGRSVFRSELYQSIEGIPGVDRVQRLLLDGDEIVSEKPLSSPLSLVELAQANLKVTVVDA